MKERRITVDASLAEEAGSVFARQGMTLEQAVSIFLSMTVETQSNPLCSDTEHGKGCEPDLSRIPRVGYHDKNGHLVLPKELDDPEDDIYDD